MPECQWGMDNIYYNHKLLISFHSVGDFSYKLMIMVILFGVFWDLIFVSVVEYQQ